MFEKVLKEGGVSLNQGDFTPFKIGSALKNESLSVLKKIADNNNDNIIDWQKKPESVSRRSQMREKMATFMRIV
jgi:hypothetical protein